VTEKGDELGDDPAVDDHLYLLVAAVREVGEGPDRVHQDVDVVVVDQHGQGRQDLLDRRHRRRRILNYVRELFLKRDPELSGSSSKVGS
jgi:hypothetical protein